MSIDINSIALCVRQIIMPKDTIVFSIKTEEGTKVFESPKLASEIKCPKCGCEYGFLHVKERCWICANLCYSTKKEAFKLTIKSIESFGVPEILKNAKFENCRQSKSVLDSIKKYSEKFKGFLIFKGSFGTGKSYAASALLEEYRRGGGISARFLNLVDLYENWKECIQGNLSEKELVEPFKDCELLVLDDVGTRAPTSAFLDFFYLLLDKRCSNKNCGTILTTNLENQELQQTYGSRILSRIGSGITIKFMGDDRRQSY